MWHCSDAISAFDSLEPEAQQRFLDNLPLTETKDTLKAFLISCARLHSWKLLEKSLNLQVVRDNLWAVIDDLQVIAHHDGYGNELYAALPSELTQKEGRLALVFPSTQSSWEIAEKLMRKGALPGKETFVRAFSAYLTRSKSPYEFNLLTNAICADGFDWREYLSLPHEATSVDLIKRAEVSSKPAYYACGFALMEDEQKSIFITGLKEKGNIEKIYPHITVGGPWMDYLDCDVKAKILSDAMGI